MSLFAELKRRNVFRVGIAYAIGAWLVLQLTEVLTELLHLPDTIGPIVVAVVVIGLPIVLALSWAFELTTEGLKRDNEVAPDKRSSGKFINALIIGLLAVALGYFVWESRFRGAPQDTASTGASTGTTNALGEAIETPELGRSIAVLPFESFSGNREDEYFADGLADTLLHKLAQIDDLKVIARNSSFQFKGSNRDVREIGKILDVETILEGSVQRAGDRVRIIAQLVRTSDGAHVWSQSFDDAADNIFALQDRITNGIVDQFQLSLSASEQQRLMRDGTDDPVAYDLLIRALNLERNIDDMADTSADDDARIQLLKQAIGRDPGYALAWAHLSRAYNALAFAADSAQDFERYVGEAQAAANESMRLDPTLAMPHSALGWVAHRKGERLVAAQHFRRALELDPNALDAMSGLALQLAWSNPEEALALLDRILELDPTSAITHRQKHFALLASRRFDDAAQELKRAIDKEPSTGIYYNDLADLLERQGRPDEGAKYASRLLQLTPDSLSGQMALAEAWLAAGDTERASQWIGFMLRDRSDSDATKLLEVERLLTAGAYQAALEQLEEVVDLGDTSAEIAARRLAACLALEQSQCALQQAGRIQALVDEAQDQGALPPDFQLLAALAQLLADEQAGSGSDIAEVARELLTWEVARLGSPYFGPIFYARAGLHARAGDNDAALAILEESLPESSPAVFNADLFQMNVEDSLLLEPLRKQAAYAEWLARYRERSESLKKQMADMEARGEILPLSSAKRMVKR